MLVSTDYTGWMGSRSRAVRRLAGTPFGVEFPRAEVLLQVLAGGLDEPGIRANLLYLQGRGVASHVLLLYHVAQVRPLAQAVDDVLDDPLLPRRRLITAKQPVPERPLSLFRHSSPPCSWSEDASAHPQYNDRTDPPAKRAPPGRREVPAPAAARHYALARAPTSDSAIWTALVAAPLSRLS